MTPLVIGEWAGAATAVLTLAGIVHRKVFRPIARVDAALPVLLSIAEQFQPNSGKSLHDQISGINRRLSTVERDVRSIRQEVAK